MRIFRRFCLRMLFLFFALLRSTIVSPATEKEILLEFKGNVTDDPYNSLKSWDPSPDRKPCSDFNGVVCDSDGNVVKIVLQNANLAGTLSPSLSSLRFLRILSLFGNRFAGTIPPEFAEIGSMRKLNVSKNALSGELPEFIGDLDNLRLLDLSKNSFLGEIPSALFKNCFRTRFISLSHNNLTGQIPISLANCLKLEGFDFSNNNFTGTIPSQICEIPSISFVSLRSNFLAGDILDRISTCHSLEYLDLSSNSFTGLISLNLLGLKNLSYFNASFNQLQGEIPELGTCSDRMEILDVSRNSLSGKIPSSIANCRNMENLNLGFNQLNGSIPMEIGDLKGLKELHLGNNSIGGRIPAELGSLEFLQILDLHDLRLSDEIPIDLTNCRFLLELDFSGNQLQGEIPPTLNNMTYLKILDLHRNKLDGIIPSTLGDLLGIQFLDLSENLLNGSIPPSFRNFSKLTNFNLSFNNLTGPIPNISIIQQFGPDAFSHNPGLCGPPLDTPCSPNSGNGAPPGPGKARLLSVSAIVAIVAAAVILTGVCVISIMNIRARRRRRDEEVLVLESTPPTSTDSNLIIGKLVLFSKSLPSRYEDWEAGTKALFDKNCLIGGGSIGTVYRTNFEGGVSIAVKKLETLGRIRNQDDFEQEIGRLGSLRHPNLVAFQGYYWSSTMHLILSEFVPNGNLYQHLHGYGSSTSTSDSRRELYWSRRFGIALGTARALAHLHHDCKPQVLHLNIKSTNILLDEGYEAKLSDYGLGKLLPMLDNYALTKFHTAVGYIAPELAVQSFRISDKCDVYSFGVILLELVTGRKPVESTAAGEVVVLCDYVRGVLESGTVSVCFDQSLRGFAENELIQVMKLGLICTTEDTTRRPSMAEVVQVLESIKPG